jgi:hypothetical protein
MPFATAKYFSKKLQASAGLLHFCAQVCFLALFGIKASHSICITNDFACIPVENAGEIRKFNASFVISIYKIVWIHKLL